MLYGEVKLVGIEGKIIVIIAVIIHKTTAIDFSFPWVSQNKKIETILMAQNVIIIMTPVPITFKL